MSTDDFEPDAYEDDEEEEYDYRRSSDDSDESLKDKYDRFKENKEKYEKKYKEYQEKHGNKNNTSNDYPQSNNEQFRNNVNRVRDEQLRDQAASEGAKQVGKETAKEGAKEAGKEAAKEGAKEAGKEVAKEAGKEAAKEGAKVATKEGTKAAVEAGTSATGVGVVVAIGIELLDQLGKKIRALYDKEFREKEKEKKRKKRRRNLLIIVALLSLILLPIFLAGPLLVTSDETTSSLEELIKKHEKENTDEMHNKHPETKSISTKSLLMFNASEYRELMLNANEGEVISSKETQFEETLKSEWGTDIINFWAGSEDLKDKDEFEISANIIKEIIDVEKNNFNNIKWYVASGRGLYQYNRSATFSSLKDMENKDKKPTRPPVLETSELNGAVLQEVPYTELKVPNLSTYDVNPGVDSEIEKAYIYIQAAEPYIQKWYIPYTIMIDTQNINFVRDIINKMYHPIEFSIYEINRENKTTTTDYYLETSREKVWNEWVETTTGQKKVILKIKEKDGERISTRVVERTDQEQTVSTTPELKKQQLPKSNTRDTRVGTEYIPQENSRETITNTKDENYERYLYSYTYGESTDEDGITTYYKVDLYMPYVIEMRIKDEHRIVTTLTDGGKVATDENGPMVKKIQIDRNIVPYRYIPKVTHAEAFYEVVDASYTVIPIDENEAPKTSEESALSVSSDSSYGRIVVKETWDESLSSGTYQSNPYKVSYYSDADLEKLGRKVSRIEWYQDWGDTTQIEESSNVDISIDDVSGAVTSENMTKLLEQAKKMVNEGRWTYSQGGDRGVATTLEQLYAKRNIDCSAFVSSLYNIYLGVNPGSWTGGMKDIASSGQNGFVMYDINSVQKQPGDILWRTGHVGLYIGNGVQIDAGGPTGVKEPNQGRLPSGYWAYTHIIRYVGGGADFSGVEVSTDDITSTNNTNTESEPSTLKGIMHPGKTSAEKLDAYKYYGPDEDGLNQGYSYDDMYFAYSQIEARLSSATNQNSSGVTSSYGGFGWPVEIIETDQGSTKVINCLFGYTPVYGSDHTGVDISSARAVNKVNGLSIGPNILAAHDGTVTRVTSNPTTDADGYTYVNIKSTDGVYTTQYGHLSKINVTVGQTVKKGQVIGKMGTTGNSTGVHLHFTVTDSAGNRLDPLSFYNIAKASQKDVIINLADIDLMQEVTMGNYIFHSEKSTASMELVEYIRGWESSSTPPMNADGTKYIIYNDGAGNATVGYGVDIFNGGVAQRFIDAGYSTSIGGEVPIAFVDAIEKEKMMGYMESIVSRTDGLGLKDYQLHALVSRAYNCGVSGAVGTRNGKTFVEAYQAYWTASDLLEGAAEANYNHPLYTNYMAKPNTSGGVVYDGLVTRRKKEWALFQTGKYDNTY